MPSSRGLLEERESAARQRVDGLREEAERVMAALAEAERAFERAVVAREELCAAWAEAEAGEQASPAGSAAVGPGAVAPGSVVPVWREGMPVEALASDYQRIVAVVDEAGRGGGGAMKCRQIAEVLGWQATAAKVEGLRSKARRLAERGWLEAEPGGAFSSCGRRGGGS